uniref:Retrovirus-related Pol polyprotein from transposon TNT 1-94 n=1 Tax=Tanacetum cinerariifolium TaxID=118510 RepID=A0A6L2JY05_TANCI|nr:retrovirus-related Pol polyprotein from transposon TNT 1-94 [Tanacetum cinerariifolium]
MANLSEDIQCTGSDTWPPMLDRTYFASWKQRIRLYCHGKENGDSVKMLLEGLKVTKEDHESQLYDDFEHFCQHKEETIHDYYVRFAKLINDIRNIKMTMSRIQLNSKFVNNMLPEWGRFLIAVKLNRGLRDSNYDQLYAYLKQHEAHANENKMMLDRFTQHTIDHLALMSNVSYKQYYSQSSTTLPSTSNRGQENNARGAGATGYGGARNRVGNANSGQARQIKCYNCNDIGHRARNCTQPKRGQDNAVDEDMDEQPIQDLALNVDNVFQADDYDAFDYDVDETPTAQTMFMVNLSSVVPVYDEASSSYDSDILSEVHDHDHYQDPVCEHHKIHEMHDDVQPNYAVNSHNDYTSESNMISYDQYVKDNIVPDIQSSVSSVPNDAYIMILNDMHEQPVEHVFVTTQNNVDDNSLSAELATYKEKLNFSRFSDMHEALNATQKRIVELKYKNYNLQNKIQNDDHDVMELVEYVIGTCLNDFNKGDKHIASTPVTFMDPCETSTNNTLTHVKQQTMHQTDKPVIPSTGVTRATAASGSKPKSNTKKYWTLPAKSDMQKVEVHPMNN